MTSCFYLSLNVWKLLLAFSLLYACIHELIVQFSLCFSEVNPIQTSIETSLFTFDSKHVHKIS